MNSITKIEIQKRNKNRVNIYIDEEFAFSCSTEIVYKQKLACGIKVDEENLKSIVEEDNFIRCKNDALRIVERTYKSEKEMSDKLLLKGYDLLIINRAIDFLKEYNLIDDSKFAEMYIKEKLANEGTQKIKFSLMRKGIPEEIIKNKLQNINSENIIDSAISLGRKKYEALSRTEKDKRKVLRKLSEYLVRRGYSFEEVKSVVARITGDYLIEE